MGPHVPGAGLRRRWLRRGATFLGVTAVTALVSLYWLYGGDLGAAVEPVIANWNADDLAREQGFEAGNPQTSTDGAPAEPAAP